MNTIILTATSNFQWGDDEYGEVFGDFLVPGSKEADLKFSNLNRGHVMIFERWDTQFNIEKLRSHLIEKVLPLEAVYQSPSFGGWSVFSSDGSYKDGWHRGFLGLSENMALVELRKQIEKSGGKPASEYVLPTEICSGYLLDVMQFIQSKGLRPTRARIIQLPAGHACVWHRDTPDNIYCLRLHVPIITNSACYFEVEDDRVHLPADGSSYFIPVNRMHRVNNEGDSHRYHLVMNVRDDLGISENYKWPSSMST